MNVVEIKKLKESSLMTIDEQIRIQNARGDYMKCTWFQFRRMSENRLRLTVHIIRKKETEIVRLVMEIYVKVKGNMGR